MKKSAKFISLCKKYEVNPDNVNEVMSFEQACKITGDDPKQLPVVDHLAVRHQKRQTADYKLSIIADALRGMLNVDYTNSSYKYFPVFEVKADKKRPSGFGLSYFGYDGWYSRSFVSVRLCFPNYDTAKFFGKHFIDLHTDHHLLT